MASSSKVTPPGIMEVHRFHRLAGTMGMKAVGPLPYGFKNVAEEEDRERIAAVCYVVNSVWLAPESERDPSSNILRFAARLFEIQNPTEEHNTTAEDDQYWSVVFISNYVIGETVVNSIMSALGEFEFDFHFTVGMRSHITTRTFNGGSYGVGLIVKIEKHDWKQKREERERVVLAEEKKRQEEELLQSAFSSRASVVCIQDSGATTTPSAVRRFSAEPEASRYENSYQRNDFKPNSRGRGFRTSIANNYNSGLINKPYKPGFFGKMIDFACGIDANKI